MSEQNDPEHDTRRRFWIALSLAALLALVDVARAAGPARLRTGWLDSQWLELLLATPVVLWCGWPLLQRSWRSIIERKPNMFTLVGLGVALAYGVSAFVTLAPQLFPAVLPHGARPPLYFDSAAIIVTLVLLGQLLELRAWRHASQALRPPLDCASTPAIARELDSPAPVQHFADRAAAWLVRAVLVVATVAACGWWALGPEPRVAHALVIAVSTLVIASPYGLVLAAPMAMTVAMGRGLQAGVLFRSAEALERLRDVDTVVFDRTGTLTLGQPKVASLLPVDGVVDSELLRLAASLVQASEHPVAGAVVALAQARGLRLGRNSGFRAVPGKGALGVVQMCSVAVGSAALMAEAGVDVHALEPEAQRLRALGQTVIYVGLDGIAVGLLGLTDRLRPEAWEVVQQLKAEGIRVAVLSGDHEESVRAVAAQLGIEDVVAGIRPESKATSVAELRAGGNVVALVGDSVDDAPALAAADLGIALGGVTDAGAPAVGLTLLGDDLHGLVRALRLSEATLRNVGQSLVFALGYTALSVPLAAGVLFHVTGWSLAPAIAAVAMLFSWTAVIGNALRLRSTRL